MVCTPHTKMASVGVPNQINQSLAERGAIGIRHGDSWVACATPKCSGGGRTTPGSICGWPTTLTVKGDFGFFLLLFSKKKMNVKKKCYSFFFFFFFFFL
jgi:hypothetical protein